VVAVDRVDTGALEAMLCIAKSRFGLVAMVCVDLGIRYVYWMLCIDYGGLVRDVYIVLGSDVQMIQWFQALLWIESCESRASCVGEVTI